MADSLPRLPSTEEVLHDIGKPRPTGIRRAVRRASLVGLTLALVVSLVVAWRVWASKAAPVRYLTAAVERGDLASTVSATGTLRGKDTVTVGAEISGRVKAVLVDFNDAVSKGQLLCEIDSTQLRANLDQVRAQLASAHANLRDREATVLEARLTAERTRSLKADGLAPTQQREAADAAAQRAVAAVESARAQITVAAAAVESTRTSLAKTGIRAPIDGVVLSRSVDVGQTLAATMSTPELFRLASDLKQMELTVAIDEADIGRTRAGQHATFTVDAYPDRRFDSEISAIHNVAVSKDNVVTYQALLTVRNDELLLRPGMTATATLQTEQRHGVLLVPNAALRFAPQKSTTRTMFTGGPPGQGSAAAADGKPRVWVLRQGAPEEHLVQAGLSDGVHTEVRAETLAEGDLAILDVELEPVR